MHQCSICVLLLAITAAPSNIFAINCYFGEQIGDTLASYDVLNLTDSNICCTVTVVGGTATKDWSICPDGSIAADGPYYVDNYICFGVSNHFTCWCPTFSLCNARVPTWRPTTNNTLRCYVGDTIGTVDGRVLINCPDNYTQCTTTTYGDTTHSDCALQQDFCTNGCVPVQLNDINAGWSCCCNSSECNANISAEIKPPPPLTDTDFQCAVGAQFAGVNGFQMRACAPSVNPTCETSNFDYYATGAVRLSCGQGACSNYQDICNQKQACCCNSTKCNDPNAVTTTLPTTTTTTTTLTASTSTSTSAAITTTTPSTASYILATLYIMRAKFY